MRVGIGLFAMVVVIASYQTNLYIAFIAFVVFICSGVPFGRL